MGLWSALSRLAPGMVPQGVILLYHRVADVACDPQLLCVTPENFAGHMEVIRSRYRPFSLRSIADRALQPPWSVAVTFDDGYADNLVYAKPILRKLRVPATVFVSSGFIGTGEAPYWDELDHLLLRSPKLPCRLVLDLGNAAKSWELGAEPPAAPGWNVLQSCTLQRQRAYLALCDHLRQASPKRRGLLMAQLRDWAGTGGEGREADRFLTAEELRLLAEDGLVELGAHTVTHPDLALLSAAEQKCEIVAGKKRLEELTGRQVESFSYPYGTRENYSGETVRLVQEAGFGCACSNFAGAVRPGADRYQLPRMLVRNWTAEEFARRLSGFFR